MPIIYKNGNIYGGASSADDVSFDDTTSGLSATNVQDAIDEVVERVWEGTLAQYNAITVKDPDTVYYVTDAVAPVTSALAVTYNNSTSELSATNVQAAIDELAQGGVVTPPAEYDSTETYNAGDFVTYNDDIYMCVTNIEEPEAWDSNHWSLVDADDSYLHSINPKGAGSFSLNADFNGNNPGICSFTEGYKSGAFGYGSHAEGGHTTASGSYSHAEGSSGLAFGNSSHAEGFLTDAHGADSHAEGYYTHANGTDSHAEGYYTTASGGASHAEGNHTTASGDYAHAEGASTTASGPYSHSEGNGTTANHRSQHVFGEFNTPDPSILSSSNRGNYVEIVGNGDKVTASNARTLDWSGNEVLSGGLKINGTQDVATQVSLTQAEYDALVSAGTVDLVNTIYFITDANATACSASEVTYSNTSSGLSADTVQEAIDEVVDDLTTSSVITPQLSGVSTSTSAGEVVKYWKSGKVVTITFDLIVATVSSATTIFTLRSGYIPPEQITLVATAFTSSTTAASRYCQIYANGNVVIYSGDQSRLLFTVTYVAA